MSFSASTPTRIGRYRIIRRLASGGLAEVYLGVSEGPDGFVKPVAIKRLHSYFSENASFIYGTVISVDGGWSFGGVSSLTSEMQKLFQL